MNILAINGSPRKGNTEFMLDVLLEGAEVINLRQKEIKFCGGGDDCCPKTGKCYIKDDMVDIYSKLEKADLIVLASPCYFFNVTARMKNFMDRCNPYYFNKKLKGKRFFLLAVGGYKPSLKEAIKAMGNFVKGVHGRVVGEYYAVADKMGELEKNKKVIRELMEIGKKW